MRWVRVKSSQRKPQDGQEPWILGIGISSFMPKICEGRLPALGDVMELGQWAQQEEVIAFPPATNVTKSVQGFLHWVQTGGTGSTAKTVELFVSNTSRRHSFRLKPSQVRIA